MPVKIMKAIIIVQAVVIALGIFAVMCFNDYRMGRLVLPPTTKSIMSGVLCIGTLLFFVLGATGWFILITLFYEDVKRD